MQANQAKAFLKKIYTAREQAFNYLFYSFVHFWSGQPASIQS